MIILLQERRKTFRVKYNFINRYIIFSVKKYNCSGKCKYFEEVNQTNLDKMFLLQIVVWIRPTMVKLTFSDTMF